MNTPLKQIIPKSAIHSLGRWIFSRHCFIVFNSYLRVIVRGKENLPSTPFIICSNHQSHLDAIILSHIGAFDFSRSALIAAKDYWYDDRRRFFWSRFFFNIIPINRRENAREFNVMHVIRLVKAFMEGQGRCIVMLPEGSRSKDGQIKPFKKGISIIAKATELPIVPVYIDGSGRFWPKGSFFIRPGKMEVRIGKPIFPVEMTDADCAEMVRESIIALSKNGQ